MFCDSISKICMNFFPKTSSLDWNVSLLRLRVIKSRALFRIIGHNSQETGIFGIPSYQKLRSLCNCTQSVL